MNALVDFQNSILLVSEIHEEVTLITVVYNDKKQGKWKLNKERTNTWQLGYWCETI